MKSWADNHPKAALMARKRAAILEAAREAFLRDGYEGSSMESIAEAAQVSVMTLYRHARSKDDLFTAVVLQACEYSPDAHEADAARFLREPLPGLLAEVGALFRDKLARPETVAVLRIVMTESARFPQLAEAAYAGYVGAWQDNLDGFLAARPDAAGLSAARRKALVATFFDQLVGTDVLRALLGVSRVPDSQRKRQLEKAVRQLVEGLGG